MVLNEDLALQLKLENFLKDLKSKDKDLYDECKELFLGKIPKNLFDDKEYNIENFMDNPKEFIQKIKNKINSDKDEMAHMHFTIDQYLKMADKGSVKQYSPVIDSVKSVLFNNSNNSSPDLEVISGHANYSKIHDPNNDICGKIYFVSNTVPLDYKVLGKENKNSDESKPLEIYAKNFNFMKI